MFISKYSLYTSPLIRAVWHRSIGVTPILNTTLVGQPWCVRLCAVCRRGLRAWGTQNYVEWTPSVMRSRRAYKHTLCWRCSGVPQTFLGWDAITVVIDLPGRCIRSWQIGIQYCYWEQESWARHYCRSLQMILQAVLARASHQKKLFGNVGHQLSFGLCELQMKFLDGKDGKAGRFG